MGEVKTDNEVQNILIVEDEVDLAELLEDYLKAAGYDTQIVLNGDEVAAYLASQPVHLILLDLMLPGKNGLDICKSVRSDSDLPIIMVTAKVEEIDRLLGLELGADDYICKPFSPKEVVARVKAVLRRHGSSNDLPEKIVDITLDENRLTLVSGDREVELTKVEFNLFKLLYQEPGKIFNREQILKNIYSDYRVVSNRTVDSHIKKLRKKITIASPDNELIKSIYGIGYKYEP